MCAYGQLPRLVVVVEIIEINMLQHVWHSTLSTSCPAGVCPAKLEPAYLSIYIYIYMICFFDVWYH